MGARRAGNQRAGNRRLGQTPGVLGLGVSTGGNTLGTTGSRQGTIVLAGVGGITLSQSTGALGATVSISAATESGIGLAAGTQTATSGVVVLANSNGVSFGMSGSSQITASIAGGGIALAAGTQTATSGSVVFSNSNGISFGLSGSTRVTGSYDGVRSVIAFDATGGVSTFTANAGVLSLSFAAGLGVQALGGNPSALLLGNRGVVSVQARQGTVTTAGSFGIVEFGSFLGSGIDFGASLGDGFGVTVTAAPSRVSYLENWRAADLLAADIGNSVGSLAVQRFVIPQARISATMLDAHFFVSNSSSAGATLTFRWGIYGLSGSTATLLSSASRTGGYNSTLAASSYTNVSNWRAWTVPVAWDLTPGDYLMAFNFDRASALTDGTYSIRAGRNSTFLGEPYVAQNYSRYFDVGVVNTNGIPASIHLSAITQTSNSNSSAPVFPWFKLIGSF